MEAIKYQKHSNRLFAKPLFNIRDDSKEKGRVYRNNPNPKTVFFQKNTDAVSGHDPDPALITDTRCFLCCYALLLPTRGKTNKKQRTFFIQTPR